MFKLFGTSFFICFWIASFAATECEVWITNLKTCFRTNHKFLSNALSISFLHTRMPNFTAEEWTKFTKLLKPLSPSYLRLGGTDADRLIFKTSQNIITEQNWIDINYFAKNSNVTLIFDANVLLRKGVNWDPENVKKMLGLTKKHEFKINFQLGNEPNSFPHVFNYTVSPKQLGQDFQVFKRILQSDEYFKKSLLIGPDVTSPKRFTTPAVDYLKSFLNVSVHDISAVSWHQYYVNGRTATVGDFLNPLIMDGLKQQIRAVIKTVRSFSKTIPVWLTETGSAYGGGAKNLSNRFASIFFFLDKLGMSAKHGVSVIMRQCLFQGHYSLLDDFLNPNPDYWISLLYKQIVGNRVFCNYVKSNSKMVRIYIQSVRKQVQCVGNLNLNPKLVVFGMNLAENDYEVTGLENYFRCATYVFQGENLESSAVFLNKFLLNWTSVEPNSNSFAYDYASNSSSNIFPGRSVVFWILSEIN